VRCEAGHVGTMTRVYRFSSVSQGVLRSENQSLDGRFEFRNPVSEEFYPCPLAPTFFFAKRSDALPPPPR
jgi:hypothetical protein